ncbi:hypothetical protein OCS_00334 [Ophiocordyceps sinensis CO18]|uniref:Uncharacterized protein n=1 Tax=Ophiocordyceps sinensis (strain Co18 / CGMCC 3.14243) TaxID=911162 RepID=T5AEP8_OPHSC|nr:hypothetical protein OCS_00334 [Ophiocordyceps sinensis CO18]
MSVTDSIPPANNMANAAKSFIMPSTILLLLALAVTCAAKSETTMYSSTWCPKSGCISTATFYVNKIAFDISGDTGCQQPDIPGMTEICIADDPRMGYFKFSGQPLKCMKRVAIGMMGHLDLTTEELWGETPCDEHWRDITDWQWGDATDWQRGDATNLDGGNDTDRHLLDVPAQ